MEYKVDHIVRSVAIAVVGLPVVLSLNNLVNVTADLAEKSGKENSVALATDDLKGELAGPCLKWIVSKKDSKLERDAKDEIDAVLGGEVSHEDTCNWVF